MKRKSGDTRQSRATFHQIVEESRAASAARAWERAKLASRLRHHMIQVGRRPAARVLGRIKLQAIERAVGLLPQDVVLTVDADFHVGLLSIRWNGHGRLHLPASALLTQPLAKGGRAAG